MTLTSYDYVLKNGAICPVCEQADGVHGGSFDIGNGGASQEMFCACGAQWDDIYSLEKYANLVNGERS
jgi:hypothetical protein